jgi:hypothetical protein
MVQDSNSSLESQVHDDNITRANKMRIRLDGAEQHIHGTGCVGGVAVRGVVRHDDRPASASVTNV